ncbi:MAG: ROK family protein [Chloroflexota bacterium]
MTDGVVIGVDLGGTRIRAARCDQNLTILERTETLTQAHEGLDATLNRIRNLIDEVIPDDDTPVSGIGISAPGPLNPETGVVVAPPNLPGWHNVPLGDHLHSAFDVPIFVGNDANVAALAETLRGAAVGAKNVIYITVSTGIGGGVITDGHLLLGDVGLAAEIGHMQMVVNDKVTSLELEAAGPALARKLRNKLETTKSASEELRTIIKTNGGEIDGKVVGQAAIAGDAVALEIVRGAARILGLGIVNLLHVFNPSVVVIGGGVANGLGSVLLDPTWETIRNHALDRAYWENLEIAPAKLGEDVSIYGAAALVVTGGGVKKMSEVMARFEQR